ncbi:hypothetical protein [Flavobacterium sp. ov086]|uniref:hypothetical protein n=1 Tax=Flavobacterium sp. ov086 TaxID=1761785 RepID=UPI000B68F035|nr:hypothetical protein [Flavobacterium sp. ov086]SNR40693.1 hypothetical protein SAMN04487979_10553 [Flavobacterium sp. ov086]
MENKDRNYHSLRAEFYKKKMPSQGFDLINHLISENRNNDLHSLLGHHRERGYYGLELDQRFWTDELIGYYNLLLLAVFAGFMPRKFNNHLTQEIIKIMSDEAVKIYYEEHYPYKLAEYTREFAFNKMEYNGETNEDSLRIFNDYISLNRFLKNDDDIDVFLGMLDYVSYGNYDISHVIESLKSFEKLSKIIISENKSILAQGVWGFIKYTSFISQLKIVMESANDFPVLQSAIWLYHEYYFNRLQMKMELFFDEAFFNLEKTMSNELLFKEMVEELYNQNVPKDFNYKELMDFSKKEISDAKGDITYILDERWSFAIADYFKEYQREVY